MIRWFGKFTEFCSEFQRNICHLPWCRSRRPDHVRSFKALSSPDTRTHPPSISKFHSLSTHFLSPSARCGTGGSPTLGKPRSRHQIVAMLLVMLPLLEYAHEHEHIAHSCLLVLNFLSTCSRGMRETADDRRRGRLNIWICNQCQVKYCSGSLYRVLRKYFCIMRYLNDVVFPISMR